MKKHLGIIIILLLILTSCNKKIIMDTTNTTTWKQIVGKEWSNLDRFPGDGFYFYEDNGVGYCTFFIYGSGVPVVYQYTSEVIIEEEGVILISILIDNGLVRKDKEEEVLDISLDYEDNIIKYDGREYDVLFDGNSSGFIENN